jgi:hypothetical protein
MPFTYTIRITNTGQVTFDPLVLTDTLPSEFHYVQNSGVPTDPDVVAEPMLVWQNLGPLDPGVNITVTFQVTATPGITGTYVNVALVSGEYPGGVITDTDDAPVAIVDPAVVLDKRLVGFDQDPWAPNYVTFTIVITNVGVSTIDVLPLLDQYDPYYLSFVWADPMPDEPEDDGIVTWYDLTVAGTHGFGQDLPPGESFLVTTVFSVVHEIMSTINTAIVSDTQDIYGNPANDDEDDEEVVGVPTAVELLYFRATPLPGAVLLEWETAVEIDNYGFLLLRSASDRLDDAPYWTRYNAEEIAFVPAAGHGRGSGATYSFKDDTMPAGIAYTYWLVDVDTSGRRTVHEPVVVTALPDSGLPYGVYLPLITK